MISALLCGLGGPGNAAWMISALLCGLGGPGNAAWMLSALLCGLGGPGNAAWMISALVCARSGGGVPRGGSASTGTKALTGLSERNLLPHPEIVWEISEPVSISGVFALPLACIAMSSTLDRWK